MIEQAEFDKKIQGLQIVCAAMSAGVLVYGAAALLIPGSPAPPSQKPILDGLYGVGATLAVAALFFKGRLLSEESLRRTEAPLRALQTRVIVLFGLADAVGLLGLLAFLLFRRPTDLAAFVGGALALCAALWPRKDRLAYLLRADIANPAMKPPM